MRVSYVKVTNLFGLYTHEINFNLNEGITIIHGPNGLGKTTILNLINHTIKGNMFELSSTPFKEFEILFDDETIVKVIQENFNNKNSNNFRNYIAHNSKYIEFPIVYEITRPNSETKRYKPKTKTENSFPLINLIESELPNLRRVGSRVWRDINTGEHYSLTGIMQTFGHLLSLDEEKHSLTKELEIIKESIPVHYIGSDRLLKLGNSESDHRYSSAYEYKKEDFTPSVNLYSIEITKSIESLLAMSAAFSQELDRTFPERLLNKMMVLSKEDVLTENEIQKRLQNLENKRIRLESVGLLDESTPSSVSINEHMNEQTRKILTLYIEDTEQKLKVFDDMEKKINLMKDILNRRNMLQNKTMKINRKEGFIFELPTGVKLTPDKLSSGEQHEIVLHYELLFKTKPNSIILIDEPEISLHISWQQQFLKDMLQISKLTGINMLIATHSPDIIHNHWDFAVELGGLYE